MGVQRAKSAPARTYRHHQHVVAKRKAPSNKALSKKIKHIENDLIELKFYDESNTFSGFTSTPTVATNYYCLNNLQQGDTVNTRNGNKIWPTSLQLKYVIVNNALLIGPSVARVLVIWDNQANGASTLYNVNGSFTFFGPIGVLDNSVITDIRIMPRAYESQKRYKILYDKIHVLRPPSVDVYSITNNTSATATMTGTAVIDTEVVVRKTIKLGRQMIYQDGTTNISSIQKGALSIMMLSDQASNGLTGLSGTRLYFKDA